MVRNGLGPVQVRQPRVDVRRLDDQCRRQRFTTSILPPYPRRTKSRDDLIPWLFCKGVSSGDASEAFSALVGPDAAGLSSTSVVRLEQV